MALRPIHALQDVQLLGPWLMKDIPCFIKESTLLITIPYPHHCRCFSPEVKSILIETV